MNQISQEIHRMKWGPGLQKKFRKKGNYTTIVALQKDAPAIIYINTLPNIMCDIFKYWPPALTIPALSCSVISFTQPMWNSHLDSQCAFHNFCDIELQLDASVLEIVESNTFYRSLFVETFEVSYLISDFTLISRSTRQYPKEFATTITIRAYQLEIYHNIGATPAPSPFMF